MSTIKKVVITAAGTGTRLLPFTKETPKEMLPIFSKFNSNIILKPILQVIFESIYDIGIRDFCFVVGRGKRSIEDHFLIPSYSQKIMKNYDMNKFFSKIETSNLVFIQQSSPKGFGDAVLKSKSFVNNENFLLHAGDDIIVSNKNDHLKRLSKAFHDYDADMAFLVVKHKDPRSYGVIEYESYSKGVYFVNDMVEKPSKPKTNLAVIATYIFKPNIFDALKHTKYDKNNELQLATAVREIIKKKNSIAVELNPNEYRLDVGNPLNYYQAISDSFSSVNK